MKPPLPRLKKGSMSSLTESAMEATYKNLKERSTEILANLAITRNGYRDLDRDQLLVLCNHLLDCLEQIIKSDLKAAKGAYDQR